MLRLWVVNISELIAGQLVLAIESGNCCLEAGDQSGMKQLTSLKPAHDTWTQIKTYAWPSKHLLSHEAMERNPKHTPASLSALQIAGCQQCASRSASEPSGFPASPSYSPYLLILAPEPQSSTCKMLAHLTCQVICLTARYPRRKIVARLPTRITQEGSNVGGSGLPNVITSRLINRITSNPIFYKGMQNHTISDSCRKCW